MKKYYTLFLLILFSFLVPKEGFAQCIDSFSLTNVKDVSCKDGNDGEITVELEGGTAPFTYELVIPFGAAERPVGSIIASNERKVTFSLANGNVDEDLGIPANATYKVKVISSDIGSLACANKLNIPVVVVGEPAIGLTANLTVIDASCNGGNDGEATAIATGGTAPYTYSWNTSPVQTTQTATGLSIGIYTVTITDANGCITTESATIEQPTSLTLTTSQTDITCNGADDGEATVNVTGGTGPYAYSWNTSPVQTTQIATGLAPGTYTVTVTDDKGCSGTSAVTITEPDLLVASMASSTDASCNGAADGEATVGVTGGTAPYTYSWNTSPVQATATATGLAAGTYVVTITDANGCSTTESITIDEPAPVVVAIDNSVDASCNGANDGEATASASGGTAPYTFSWNTTPAQNSATATGLVAGTYTVTVTDANGCSETASVTIDEPTPIIISFVGVQDVTCNAGADGEATAIASGGVAPYTYTWNTTPVQNGATANGLAAGTYTVTVEDASGCSETATVTVDEPDALLASAASTDITCHGGGDGEVEITVSGGTAGYEYSLDGTNFQASNLFDNLVAGTYTITIKDANGCTVTITATINEPDALTVAASSNDATCNSVSDGAVTVTAGGGTPTYEYSLDGANFQTSNLFEGLPAGNYTITIRDVNGCTATTTATIDEPVALTAAAMASDATCNSGLDGTITVTAGGGTPNYAYSLDGTNFQPSNLFENLATGNYTITIRDDNGCTVTTTATVDAPDALVVSATATDATCNGTGDGTITVTAQDGTPSYEYALDGTTFQSSNIFTGLVAGNYTITVKDANGCTETVAIAIDEPDALQATAISEDITCHGGGDGQVEITVTGGTAGYEYSLDGTNFQGNNLFENLVAGNYTLTIKDANGCITTATATIDEPATLTASIATVTDANCNGAADGEATVSVSGGIAPYTYSWNTSPVQTTATATGLAAGTYTVTITDANGCSTTESATIAEPSPLLVTIDNQIDVSCNGGNDGEATISASGGTGPYTYSWNTTPVQITATATGLVAGVYSVTVTDAGGCSEAIDVTIEEPVILTATAATLPDCDGSGAGSIDLTVNGGTVPYTYTWSGGLPAQEDHNGTVAAGTYSVTIEDANGCTITLNDIEVAPQIIADAGSDQTICFDKTTLSANPVTADQTGVWIILSGNGDFGNINDPNTIVSNLTIGINEFIWSVSDNAGNCTPSTDTVTIVVEDITHANAGVDQSVCENEATLSANAVKTGETGLWTVLEGAGNFSNNTDPSAEVTGLLPGINQFVWTIENGLCNPSMDTVAIIYTEITPAEAGTDQVVCEDTTTLQANAPKAGESGQWIVLEGTGTFDNNTEPNTLVSDLAIGTNRFIWAISDLAGVCSPSTDTVTVVRNSISAADAGEDQIVCSDNAKLDASTVAAGEIGTWIKLSGGGILADVNDPKSDVINLSEGDNQFVWVVADNAGICPSDADTVNIHYTILSIAHAGPDQTICADHTLLVAQPLKAGEIGEWSSFGNTATITDKHNPTTTVTDLSAGTHIFIWSVSDIVGECGFRTDDVKVHVVGDLTEADAGADQEVCGDKVNLAANSVKSGENGKWTLLEGTGTILDDTNPLTLVNDLAPGINKFIWTITDNNGTCPASSDTVSVHYIIVTKALAGPDQSICADSTFLAANAFQPYEFGTWTVLSGQGDFKDANDPQTVVENLGVGLNEFIWTISDTAKVCIPTSDTVRIEVIGNLTVALAGPDQNVCVDEATLAANTVDADESGQWTVLHGAGNFEDDTDPATTVKGLGLGLNQFVWTITDNNGACPASFDTVSIHYIVVTEALAGPDQSICTDSTTLAANAVQPGELGIWTVLSGHGDFKDENDPETDVTNLGIGVNEFVWTISDAANTCAATLDTVRIEVIGNLTDADAGPEHHVCIDETTLAANAVGAGENGKWTVLHGTGNFEDDTDPATEVRGLAVGLNQFAWTITDNNGTCPASSDTVSVHYIVVTEAIAGPDQSICTDTTILAANAVQPGELGVWTVLSGHGDFENVNDPETLVENLNVGVNEFVWTITDAANICVATLDTVRIEVIGNLTDADAGPEHHVCIDETTLAANAVGAGENGKWTVIHGTGNFEDDTDPATTVKGLGLGLNQFIWTITDNNGICPASSDTVSVHYIVVTEAIAGPDQSICTDTTTLASNAVQPGELGVWTVLSGHGDFENVNDPETLVENLNVGVNEFVWTITDAANVCAATLDTVRIEVIGNLTVADAGADQDVCIDEVTLAANAVGTGETGTWVLISGTGQIDNSNNVTTLVTGLSLGDNEFEWRIIDDNGICPDSHDRVIITYDPQATPPVVAVDDFDYCVGETIIAFEATGTDIKWYDDAALTNEVGTGSPFMPTIDNTVAGSYTFYATQTAVGCGESAAVEVTVNIDNTSPAPVVTDPVVEVCQNAAFPTLVATGTNLKWYDDVALTNEVGTGASYTPTATELDMTLVGTTVFYVTQNIGCGESPAVAVSVEVTNVSSPPVVVTPGAFCQSSTQPTLVATGANLKWYIDAALTAQVGAGPSFTPNATILDMSVSGTTIFYVTQDEGCGESVAVSVAVNVLDANDPACAGGGTGCGVFTQVFIDNVINPSCNSSGIISQDGEFLFNVVGGTAPYTFRIESTEGIEEQFNNPYFDGLKAGMYLSTVKDALGNECSITYTLLVESNLVGIASNMVDAVCYGSNTGKATITITEGGSTGFYSYDDGASWFPFTSGNTVNNLPPNGTYNLLIGNQANDPCPGLVEVTINNQYDEIQVASFNTVTPASCDNNDGEVLIGAITGGSGNYTFELDGAPYTMPDDFILRGLERGEHRLSIIDDNNCRPSEPFKFHVDSPGLVLFNTSARGATCGQEDGWVEIEITDGVGPYFYAIGESGFQEVPANKFTITGLAQGSYELIIKSGNSTDACPNSRPLFIGGLVGISYEIDKMDIACYGEESGIISIDNITGGRESGAEINIVIAGPNGYSNATNDAGHNIEVRNLEAGIYTISFVQNGGCGASRTETVEIRQPRKLYAEIKEATISLPDIPTGSIKVWVDQLTGTGTYVATVHKVYPNNEFFYLKEDTVRMNSKNLQYEITFEDAPPGDYTVNLRDANGCDTTMTVLIDYDRRVFIPNVFTPNGDGANETFFVRNLPEEGAQMIITNRWGKVVYSNDNYDNTWDGGDLPDGVYYYKLILEEENFSGWVEIWRSDYR